MMFGGRGSMRSTSVGRTTSSGLAVYASSSCPHDPFSSPSNFSSTLTPKRKSSTPLSFSSSSSSSSSHQRNHWPIWHPFTTDDSDWVSVEAAIEEDDDDAPRGFRGRFIGSAPSESEVEDAVSSLQQVLGPASRVQLLRDMYCNKSDNKLGLAGQVSEDDPEIDWVEPSLFTYNSNMLQANGSDRVYYAIHLLQTDPSVQRLVKSLSTDEAFWEAVLNNEVVQELRESISADQEQVLESLDEIANDDPHNTTNVLMCILNTARARFMEVIEKITKIVIDLFQHAFNKTATYTEDSGPSNEKLRTSFMLSIMVLLIVVVSRVHS